MNVKLLRKVQKQIQKHPESYTYHWMQNGCGTRACIAGHTLLLGRTDFANKSVEQVGEILEAEHQRRTDGQGCFTGPAADLLKIKSDQASRLFIYWPKQFSNALYDPKNAAKRIEHFIKTEGRE